MSEVRDAKKLTMEDLVHYKLQEDYADGYFEPGWEMKDYHRRAMDEHGWECCIFWGIKGTKKSNRMMKALWDIYGNKDKGPNNDPEGWKLVHKYMVVLPMEYVKLLQEPGRIRILGWDDITAYLDAQLYFENRSLYTKVKRNWALSRSKMSVFMCTTPIKTKVCDFILEDMTAELFCTPRQTTTYDRWTWRKDWYDPRKVVKRPINIETRKPFDMYEVPEEEFKKYWDRKLERDSIGIKGMMQAFKEAFEESIEIEAPPPSAVTAAARILAQAGEAKKHAKS